MKTREQLKKQYRIVAVDGDKDAKEFRVKQRWLFGWTFVCKSWWNVKETTFNFHVEQHEGPVLFPTAGDAQAAIDRWVEEDYRAQPGAWREVQH